MWCSRHMTPRTPGSASPRTTRGWASRSQTRETLPLPLCTQDGCNTTSYRGRKRSCGLSERSFCPRDPVHKIEVVGPGMVDPAGVEHHICESRVIWLTALVTVGRVSQDQYGRPERRRGVFACDAAFGSLVAPRPIEDVRRRVGYSRGHRGHFQSMSNIPHTGAHLTRGHPDLFSSRDDV